MFEAFGGYFSVHDCALALKYTNGDFEEAAQWLIEEKEKPKGLKQILRSSTTLLCESEVLSESNN